MNILDVALAVQIRMSGEGLNEIGNMEARRVFLRLCAFAPILATMVDVLELAAPEAPPVDAALALTGAEQRDGRGRNSLPVHVL